MSESTQEEGGSKKKDKTVRSEAVIIDQSLFDWLEGLFYDQPAAYPERIELALIYGARRDKYGPTFETYRFAPKNASAEVLKHSLGKAQPSKEELVIISNRILARIQRECDEARKPGLYGALAWNPSASDRPYSRWTKNFEIKGQHAPRDGVEEDDEESSDEKKLTVQLMRHLEKKDELLSETMMGMMDRLDRSNRLLAEQNERHMARYEKVLDLTERLVQAESKRKSEEKWDEIRQDAAKRGLNLVSSIAPPLVGMLVTKPGTPAAAEVEVKALQEFFKTTEEGGRLTEEQANAAFGVWNDQTGQMITPGILTPDQSTILVKVAKGMMPTSELDKLVPPEGQHAISMDQFMRLSQVIPLDQLLPLKIAFDNHTKKSGAA